MKKNKLSVVLATRNEEGNIAGCIKSVKSIADEIILFDENSTDNTVKIAKELGARVVSVEHEDIFHVTKQKALEAANHEWILQLDADERVTHELAKEILNVINKNNEEIKSRTYPKDKKRLFKKHENILKQKGVWKPEGEVVAFLLPRLNLFLGKPLKYAGVYPDPAIRLVKKGKTHFPAKSVHENMIVNGATAWLFNDLEHRDSPTLSRYLTRLNRYTDLRSEEFKKAKLPLNILYLLYYSSLKPLSVFLRLYLRHKGFLDGMRGFIWSSFSAMHFPISYFKYYAKEKNNN